MNKEQKCSNCKRNFGLTYQNIFVNNKTKNVCFECFFKHKYPDKYEKLSTLELIELKNLR